jgi:hypothetical protein
MATTPFLKKIARTGSEPRALVMPYAGHLMRHGWPGNRQLCNYKLIRTFIEMLCNPCNSAAPRIFFFASPGEIGIVTRVQVWDEKLQSDPLAPGGIRSYRRTAPPPYPNTISSQQLTWTFDQLQIHADRLFESL